jgi:hypothetical protein
MGSQQPTAAQSHGFDDQGQYDNILMAQEHFVQHCNSLDRPDEAMSEYARYMHQHTKEQLHRAFNMARGRSGTGSASLSSEGSVDSVESTSS